MEDFHYVKITDEGTLLSTDGFHESTISSLSQARVKLPIHKRSQDFLRWLHAQLTQTRKPKPKESWDVYISEQVKSKLPDEKIGDFLTAIEHLQPTLKRNLGGIQDINGLHQLAEAVAMGKAIAVSDASLGSRNRAAHAYILESCCERYRIIGVAPIDCDADDLESTRAELWGQLSIQTIINLLIELYNITSGSVDVYCDNKDALTKQPIQSNKIAFPRFFRPNVDIKLEIQKQRLQYKKYVEVHLTHIKGHQDNNANFCYEQASQPTRRNIDMDEISKSFLQDDQERIEPKETQLPLPSQKVHLHLGSTLIHNNIHHHVNLHFYGPKLEKRFLHKFEIDKKFHQQIQWQALERAYRNTAKQDKISRLRLKFYFT